MSEFVNTSGQGSTAEVPAELKCFNWGAFCLNWIWGVFNKSYLTLTIFASIIAAFIPFIGAFVPLGLCIWFGLKGNEWAWQNKQWESVEQFNSVQKKWAIAGIILFALSIISTILAMVLIFGVAALSTK